MRGDVKEVSKEKVVLCQEDHQRCQGEQCDAHKNRVEGPPFATLVILRSQAFVPRVSHAGI